MGGCRLFLDEVAACLRRFPRQALRGRVQIVTGVLAAPVLQKFAEAATAVLGLEARVVPAVNNWYGPSVTVAGLLTGRDVRDALNKAGYADLVAVPDIMLRDGQGAFLDNATIPWLADAVGRRVLVVPSWPRAALEQLASWSGSPPDP